MSEFVWNEDITGRQFIIHPFFHTHYIHKKAQNQGGKQEAAIPDSTAANINNFLHIIRVSGWVGV